MALQRLQSLQKEGYGSFHLSFRSVIAFKQAKINQGNLFSPRLLGILYMAPYASIVSFVGTRFWGYVSSILFAGFVVRSIE